MFAEQPPVRVEVSRPRLVEGGSGVLRVRVVNVSGESITCTLGMQGALTDAWRDTPTVLAPGRKADRGVNTKHLARGLFVVHVSVDVERSDGSITRFVGQVDREVDALASGSAAISVNITGGDGAVIDASQLRLGNLDEASRFAGGTQFEVIELGVDSVGSGPSRVMLADQRGPKLLVISGDRLVIGRDSEQSDLVVPDPAVSGVHVEITKSEGRFVVHHRSRTNTTVLNQSSVTSERSAALRDGEESTLVLSGTWRCLIRLIHDEGTASSVRRGLVDRGVPVASSSADGAAGVLFTPHASCGPGFVPVLWLSTAMRLGDARLGNLRDPGIVLSAFRGLHEVRLSSDARVLSISSLRVTDPIGGTLTVADLRA